MHDSLKNIGCVKLKIKCNEKKKKDKKEQLDCDI